MRNALALLVLPDLPSIVDVLVIGSTLYVGGCFDRIDGVDVPRGPAAFDGTSWSAVGSGPGDDVTALGVWQGDLVVAGDFTVTGGGAADHIARWTVSPPEIWISGVRSWSPASSRTMRGTTGEITHFLSENDLPQWCLVGENCRPDFAHEILENDRWIGPLPAEVDDECVSSFGTLEPRFGGHDSWYTTASS